MSKVDGMWREELILAIQRAHYEWRTNFDVWSGKTLSEHLVDAVIAPLFEVRDANGNEVS